MKKNIQTILTAFLLTSFILFSIGCPNDIRQANDRKRFENLQIDEKEAAENISQRDKKIFSSATIQDDFDDSSLVVVLDNFTSGVNREHADSFFGQFEKESIHDLTLLTEEAKTIDRESFRQIFEIRLPKERAGKEQVLNAIREL